MGSSHRLRPEALTPLPKRRWSAFTITYLGWREVVVVDDDLGQSGSGTRRPGYDRLLAAVCRSEVGVVLSLEASRLARNGREWHTLIDYCGLVGCLLADETNVYDPRFPDDRLLLGL